MARVLFIVHDLYQDDNHFPLGIAYLAAVLEKEGHEVEVICQDITHCTDDHIVELIAHRPPDIVAMGFLAARFKETVLPLCKKINEVKGILNKKFWLVLGGHGASGCPEYIKEQTSADYVLAGEGESQMEAVAVYLSPGNELNNYKDLDSLPWPAWHLFPIDEYRKQLKMPGWELGDYTLGMTASRGCKGRCTFCQRLSKGLRFRSMENVVGEIYRLFNVYRINYIFFQDEMFVANEKRMVEFYEELVKKDLIGKIKWGGDARVDVVNKELLQLLKRTGCQFLDYGFESMDDEVLLQMKKGTTSEDNCNAARWTKEAGIPFNMNILWGMPGDSEDTLRKNITFINEFNTHSFLRTIRPPTPYPGCELFDIAVKQRLLDGPADFFDRFTNSDRLTVNFTGMSDEEFYINLYQANSSLIRNYFEKNGKFQPDKELFREEPVRSYE
jgi:radical SAM superfamily enzyme YgiQ (UPF0313 family)